MSGKYPSLNDILNDFDTIENVIRWAIRNDLLDHPTVQQRLMTNLNIRDVVNAISDPDTLKEWVIDNLLLQHSNVLDRISVLLTCELCQMKFESSSELKQHRENLHTRNINLQPHVSAPASEPSCSLTCSWCRLKMNSHAQLREHEDFHHRRLYYVSLRNDIGRLPL